MNDRADLALLAGADGVHLGDEDLPPAEARRLSARTCSWAAPPARSRRRARRRARGRPRRVRADLPVRLEALSVPPRGTGMLREVAAALGAPVVAIGGIAAANVGEVARAGAACAAVIGALFAAGDPRENAARLAAAFEAGPRGEGATAS